MTEQPDNSWKNRINDIFNQAKTKIPQIPNIQQWFTVSDSQIAEILTTIRAELPTTEALLIGKPQTGKSSIVRGLTSVSAKIVGQGFRPHTQNTQRYFYSSKN